MVKQIYEHLITKKKYNTLELKYKVKCEEFEEKVIENDAQKRINRVERNKQEEIIKEYMNEIQDLKTEISKLKKQLKEKKNDKTTGK